MDAVARRLRPLARALGAAEQEAPPSSSSGRVLDRIAQGERGIPTHLHRQPSSFRPLHVGVDGRLLPGEVAALEAELAAGGAALDRPAPPRIDVFSDSALEDTNRKGYAADDSPLPTRRQELTQLLLTLRPQPRLTLADCAPRGRRTQREFFLEHGFLIVEDIVTGETLRRCQAAYSRGD